MHFMNWFYENESGDYGACALSPCLLQAYLGLLAVQCAKPQLPIPSERVGFSESALPLTRLPVSLLYQVRR